MSRFFGLFASPAAAPAVDGSYAYDDGLVANEVRLIRRKARWTLVDGPATQARDVSGEVLVSNMRIVFTSAAAAAQIDLAAVVDDRFEQPIFGANYLGGRLRGRLCAEWRITFDEGGSMAFLRVFFAALRSARTPLASVSERDPLLAIARSCGSDASDPTTLWKTVDDFPPANATAPPLPIVEAFPAGVPQPPVLCVATPV
ncbi:hypothetical protein M885DRAFT_39916 [Pelagophyceae sp. CCMP2097]|nr:hypothetical protein M885DRAFT_39916 [Pelagophyceae sp. CCMP2097]|mmetsp:Transcript_7003/g.22737  ORF Transcript_7003/g.22737 Transcript_7003/m.22737 type:complete len:201 (+) Transcript_7003:55-657(+)